MDIITTGTITIFILGLLLCSRNDSKRKKWFLIIASMFFILISGLRNIYWGSPDTFGYSNYYSQVCKMSYSDIISDFPKDPSYHLFAKTVSLFVGDNFQIYLLIVSSFFIGSVSRLIYMQSKDTLLSVIMFLALGIFGFSMVGTRQALSLALIALSFEWIVKRKLLKFLGCMILASLFHLTSFIFIIAYPLSYLKINKKTIATYIGVLITLLILGRVSLVLFTPIFTMTDRFEGYMDRDVVLTYSGLIQLCLFLGLCIMLYKKAIFSNNNNRTMMHMLLVAIIFQSLASQLAEFFRVALYFKLFVIILIPNILVYAKNRRLITFVLMGLLLFYYLVMNSDIHEYAFYWEHYIPKY